MAVYRVTQLSTDGVHCRESAGTGPVNLKVVSVTRAALAGHHVCVCVCVFFPFILDIKFVGRTSRGHTGGRSHRIFIHLSAVRALIFLARRIQPFLSLVDREVEFCVLTI